MLRQKFIDRLRKKYQTGGEDQTSGQTLPNDWQSKIYEGQTLPDPTPYIIDVPSYVRPHMKKLHRTAYEGGNKPFHESKHSWGLGPYSPRFMKMAEDDYAHVNAAENKEEYDERMKDFDKKWRMYGISSSGSNKSVFDKKWRVYGIPSPRSSKSVFDSSKLERLKDRLDSANIAYIPYEDEITIREQGSETTRKGTTPNPNKQTGGIYDQMQQYQRGGQNSEKETKLKLIEKALSILSHQESLRKEWQAANRSDLGGRGPIYGALFGAEAYHQDPASMKELQSIYKTLGVENRKEFNALMSRQKQTGGMYNQMQQYQKGGKYEYSTSSTLPLSFESQNKYMSPAWMRRATPDEDLRDYAKNLPNIGTKWRDLSDREQFEAGEKYGPMLGTVGERIERHGPTWEDYAEVSERRFGNANPKLNPEWLKQQQEYFPDVDIRTGELPESDSEGVGLEYPGKVNSDSLDSFNAGDALPEEKQYGGYMNRMQQYQQGGMALPGGEMEQIPGSDAVEFEGQTHDQGGITLDPQTEVEDGETMDQVTMARGGGQRKDYFFSSHLKKGGKSFADMHKDILRNGGDQQEIDWLASMQESAAGRNSNKVGTAKLGGVMKYQEGGTPPYQFTWGPQPEGTVPFVERDENNDGIPDYLENTPELQAQYDAEAARRQKQLEYDLDLYNKAMKRDVPLGTYAAGAAQLLPAAYSFGHKQPKAEETQYTPGFTSPIIAERGKASKLDRVNYNVDRARNAADMRAINRYVETSGGGPANVINKMMAYSKKQQADASITAAETKANIGIANTEAQLAQQMEVSNLTRAQQAATATAQLASQEAGRADEVESWNAAARQKRIDDMEYMKFQGLSSAATGIAGITGDVLSYKGQEELARIMGPEGVYDRQKVAEIFMKEINPNTGKKYTRDEALDKARDLYNYLNKPV